MSNDAPAQNPAFADLQSRIRDLEASFSEQKRRLEELELWKKGVTYCGIALSLAFFAVLGFYPAEVARKYVEIEVPKAVDAFLKATATGVMLEKIRQKGAEVDRDSQQIHDAVQIVDTELKSLKELRQLDLEGITVKEITILAKDGKTKIGRISSDPVSTYLLRDTKSPRLDSSLRFEIGQNTQNGGSVIIRNPRDGASDKDIIGTHGQPIGIEMRAWRNEASVNLVDDTATRTDQSLIWRKSK